MRLENSLLVIVGQGPARARTLNEQSGGAEETVARALGNTGDRRDFRGNGSPVCRDKPSLGEAALTTTLFDRD